MNDIIDFSKKVEAKKEKEQEQLPLLEEDVLQDFLDRGKKEITDRLDEASGVISLIFTRGEDTPQIIWAGEFDSLQAIGGLEFAKMSLAAQSVEESLLVDQLDNLTE